MLEALRPRCRCRTPAFRARPALALASPRRPAPAPFPLAMGASRRRPLATPSSRPPRPFHSPFSSPDRSRDTGMEGGPRLQEGRRHQKAGYRSQRATGRCRSRRRSGGASQSAQTVALGEKRQLAEPSSARSLGGPLTAVEGRVPEGRRRCDAPCCCPPPAVSPRRRHYGSVWCAQGTP